MDDFSDLLNGLLHDLCFNNNIAALGGTCSDRPERLKSLDEDHSRVLCDTHLTSGSDQATELLFDNPWITLVDFSLDLIKSIQDFLLLIDSNT